MRKLCMLNLAIYERGIPSVAGEYFASSVALRISGAINPGVPTVGEFALKEMVAPINSS